MGISVENETSYIWMPLRYVSLWGNFGLQMYDIVTYIALIGGVGIWLLLTKRISVSPANRLTALVIIGVTTVVFTRLFHILFWGLEQNLAHPNLVFQVDRGRSIHGAVFGLGISAFFISKLWRTPEHFLADIVSIWAVFGLICARIGNFWNSEIVGTPTTWPTGIGFYFYGDHGVVSRHPVQLYEAGFAVLLLILLVVLWTKKKQRQYLISSIALIGLGIIRICCDIIKEDPGYLFGAGLTTGQILSIPMVLLGGWILYFPFHKRKRDG